MVRLPGARRDIVPSKDLQHFWYFVVDDVRLALLVVWVPIASGGGLVLSGLSGGPMWHFLAGMGCLCLPGLLAWLFYYRQPDPHPERDFSDDIRGRHQR